MHFITFKCPKSKNLFILYLNSSPVLNIPNYNNADIY